MTLKGDFLADQWLRLYASMSRGTDSIPGWGKLRFLHAMGQGQKNKKSNQIKLKTISVNRGERGLDLSQHKSL